MIHAWKQLVRGLFPTYEDRMNAFLSQATSREHLEVLERQWFKQNRRY
jgi:hypothetical protein